MWKSVRSEALGSRRADGNTPALAEGVERQVDGVCATGKTLEGCRQNLTEVTDGWVLVRIARRMPIPALGETRLVLPEEMAVA